jgi:phage replication-related protein YjqB (UPF0714/DUF867 family)
MTDSYNNFLELQENHHAELDYHIKTGAGSTTLIILGIHAGGIEPGTSELAQAIAGPDFSLYLFEGLGQNTRPLHLTSTHFDEPLCLEMVRKHQTALSLHGFRDCAADPLIYLGGNDLALIRRLLTALIQNGYPARVNTGKYAATTPQNICNRTISGKGVQIEISSSLRRQFFHDLSSPTHRENTTPKFEHFVQIIRSVLLTS